MIYVFYFSFFFPKNLFLYFSFQSSGYLGGSLYLARAAGRDTVAEDRAAATLPRLRPAIHRRHRRPSPPPLLIVPNPSSIAGDVPAASPRRPRIMPYRRATLATVPPPTF